MSTAHLPAPHMASLPNLNGNASKYMAPIPTAPVVMLVTPAIAADWLENRNVELSADWAGDNSTGNRKKSSVVARKYTRIVKADRWKCTHQGIAFDRHGWLIDGQHRLMAIVAAGIPVKLFIIPFVEGMDDKTFDVLDSGHKRQAAQLLSGPGSSARAAAARFLGVVDGLFGPEHKIVQGILATSVETRDCLEIIKGWPELMEWASSVYTPSRNAHVPPAAHLAVLAQAERSEYRGKIESWIEGINSGAGLDSQDPRLLVRNRFTKDRGTLDNQAGRCKAYRLLVKAWNAHATGRGLGVLKASDSEARPEVIGFRGTER